MNLRFKLLAALFATLLLATACTDAPPLTTSPDQCADGLVFDAERGACVPDGGGDNDGDNQPDNNDPNNPNPNPGAHPWDGRENLDPWGDESGDGVPNKYDNCPFHYNPDQLDSDGDGIGDVCDNCPFAANPGQEAHPDNPVDERGIIMGDVCAPGVTYIDTELDTSGDGWPDVIDNCPDHFNPDQRDTSGDGVGDVCDNCPNHYNPSQSAAPGNPVDERGIVMGDACAPVPNNIPICQTQDTNFERIQPNVYMALDISGSMAWSVSPSDPNHFSPPPGQSRWEIALQGLNQMADSVWNDIRFGMGTFPAFGTGNSCDVAHVLNIGEYTAQQIKDSYSNLGPTGGTPTYLSMMDILNNNRLSDPTDPLDGDRVKAVLLVTDGEPNCSPNYSGSGSLVVNEVVSAIEALYAQGILTYVVGFAHATTTLEAFAQAGGTGNYLLANDAASLAAAIDEIANLLVSCSFSLSPPPPDANKIWVQIDGEYLDRSQYSYDASDNVLQLSQASCDQLSGSSADSINMVIQMGCADPCVPEESSGLLCDLYYETCGAPYPCDECSPEVCDGRDNNCNGIIDDGCPECGIYRAFCERDSDCCTPFVCTPDNTCGHECYPTGVSCWQNSQCCSGTCGGAASGQPGVCVTG